MDSVGLLGTRNPRHRRRVWPYEWQGRVRVRELRVRVRARVRVRVRVRDRVGDRVGVRVGVRG